MLRFCFILLAVLTCSDPASAGSFTNRCLDRSEIAYFVTFDVDKRKAIFKSAGGNILEGPVTASGPGRIAFTLIRGNPPDFDLVWDEASAILTWIAIPNNPERGGATSRCTIIPSPDK
jgi:hypothetical protein